MTQNTLLAEHIDTAHTKAQLDEACKKLLAHKIILAWIMQQTLIEFKDYDILEIAEKYIEGIPVISQYPVHADTGAARQKSDISKEIYSNVQVSDGEYITLLINAEAQNDFYPGYPLVKRGIYYGCRMVSGQYGTEFQNSHYEKIKKVYSIWICINPPGKRANTITKYEITEKNVLGEANEPVKNFDLMSVIMICLKKAPDPDDCDKNVIDLLTTLLSTKLSSKEKKEIIERDFNIPMQMEVTKEADGMCNYSDYVEMCGIEKGENLLTTLVNRLLSDNRIEDVKLATSDEDSRKRFYQEYGLTY